MPKHARPLSPHLQIYQPQLTSMLSIAHRITGVALTGGSLLLVAWLVLAASSETGFNQYRDTLSSAPGKLMLMAWSFALFYHLLNGIRHLFWDAGHGYELDTVYTSGWAVVIGAMVMTVSTWAYALLA
jgi:succinate dehydrogenase / fumarate reductase, cytochrome b subunit